VTAQRPLICRRCGFTNHPGDQFCGSCGAFLEWEGEQASGSGAGAGRDPDVPPARSLEDQPPVIAGAPGSSAAPTQPAPVPDVAPADGPLVRCPACGIANAAGRTFCQSCGAKLAEAGVVGERSREEIAAAVNASPGPVPVRTTTIRPTRPEPASASSGGGGILKWIVLMAVLGVVAGVGLVVGMNVLRGEGPVGGATSAPSGVGQASDAPSPDVSASGGAASAGPAASPTPAPPRNEKLALLGASASSVVGDLPQFQPSMAIDGDPATCWQEGSKAEKGQWIEVVFAPSKVSAIIITNGYNASKALYRGNRRLKDIEVKVGDAAPQTFRLKDTGNPQKLNVKNASGVVAVRITILSTYPSVQTSVAGTPFDDAALGEIEVMGVPGS
jgi:hypothetical protein